MSTNTEISKIFKEMAEFLEMEGDIFRPRAYQKGASTLESLPKDVEEVYKEAGREGLETIPNIGRGMAEKIEEYIKTRRIEEYARLKKKIPVNLEELSVVEGLGPKSIKTLYEKLSIRNLKDLEDAAKAGKIRNLKGFGVKTEQNILEGVEFAKKNSGRMLLGYIWPRVRKFIDEFGAMEEVLQISEAGSLRRRKETIGDIDILVATAEPEKVIERFVGMKEVMRVWGKGPTKASVRLKDNFDMDIRVVPQESWGSALQYFTGSKDHNIALRQIAIEKGLKLNEYGVFKDEKSIAGRTEEEVYKALGLQYLEPELRENTGEIEAILSGTIPEVISYGALKGDVQVQTNWTDGDHSIEEMANEANRIGLHYIAITDHTKSLAMTGGSDEKKLLRQMAEIERINSKLKSQKSKFRVLTGAEVNIMKDGTLDISDEVLAKLDVVGVSVHSLFKMSKEDMTARIIHAMQNPNVDILFHPTGRLIQKRNAYEVDIEKVIRESVKTGTALEINALPDRLDLKDEYIRLGVQYGAKFVIDSDAHNKEHFKYLEFGIAQARRGWATENDVLNTLPVEQFLKKLKK